MTNPPELPVEVCRDVLSAGQLDRLSAVLDREHATYADGKIAPPLAHWLYFLPKLPQSQLGEHGHVPEGEVLSATNDLPRRMWAGSRIRFERDLLVGQEIERRSFVGSVREKNGTAGRFIVVSKCNEIGAPGAPPSIVEQQDVLYLGPRSSPPGLTPASADGAEWEDSITTDPTLLFRYSALTFNANRIHYDHLFATEVEGYPALIVHAPLIATLLCERAMRSRPAERISQLNIRAISPVFVGRSLILRGSLPDAAGNIRLWAATDQNRLALTAEIRLAA